MWVWQAVRARVRLGGKRNGAACGVRQAEKLSGTKLTKLRVKEKNILGMALHARACFFLGRRWPAGGSAAI